MILSTIIAHGMESVLPPNIQSLTVNLYNYTETRAGYNAADFLGDNSGYFMCDGYSGYNSLPHVKRCRCFAHVRRYLLDAIPNGRKDDYSEPAVQGNLYIEELYLTLIVKVVVSKKLKSFVALGSSCLSGSTMNRMSCK